MKQVRASRKKKQYELKHKSRAPSEVLGSLLEPKSVGVWGSDWK